MQTEQNKIVSTQQRGLLITYLPQEIDKQTWKNGQPEGSMFHQLYHHDAGRITTEIKEIFSID